MRYSLIKVWFDVLLFDGEGEEGADGVLCGVSGTDSCALGRVSQCGLCRLCRGLQRLLARDILHMFRFGWIKQVHRHLLLAARTAFQHEHFGFVELAAEAGKGSG